jgi:glycosyltransferase involved in cell wall biosynthesis
VQDPRVKYIHVGKNSGMRESINTGVRASTGEYLMRADEHCMFSPGFDEIILKDIEDDWIVTPRRFFLDVDQWEVMDIPPVDYEKLKPQDCGDGVTKWMGQPWKKRAKERKDVMIDETCGMQGSCWFMKRSWWEDVIKELNTERYGTMLGDSHEMQFKTWKAGGKLMVNKGAWFAHKHVSFPRTHHLSKKSWAPGVANMFNDWKDYYENEIRPIWKI